MSTRMLIDARHEEETRVVVIRSNRVEEFDYESAAKRQLKGNIYLAKVTRVEPSLQACFVEYGGNRHGFLAFSEIHPDYYQIPHEDREALLKAEEEAARKEADRGDAGGKGANGEGGVEQISGEVDLEDLSARQTSALRRKYKIQEVIKRRQIMLVQVVKEERGTKGAALTTYLSLAGRYCVLMPNSPHAGGISRKIGNAADRKKLKGIMSALAVPEGMGCIIRTAGLNRTKAEIKRDFDYLLRLWDGIRELTLKSIAPTLIYEEANLIKRTIRDLYTRDIEEVLVEGEEGYRVAKDFMKLLIPSHAKRVKHYRDRIPLFHRFNVEPQLESMYSPLVQLKSGGYIVINPTEALVAIDVNSGRSTKEHNVEETAVKTNLEAAAEIARQLRLRDMAGLIVVDFIDMYERSNNRAVEKRLKESLKEDRARIQVGPISSFGLIEMSRQRLRPNLLEASMEVCPTCNGSGVVRSTESSALAILRALEEEGIRGRSARVLVQAPTEVALYLLNEKRTMITELEQTYRYAIVVQARGDLSSQQYELERVGRGSESEQEAGEREVVSAEAIAAAQAESEVQAADGEEGAGEDGSRRKRPSKRRGRGRRGRGKKGQAEAKEAAAEPETAPAGEATAGDEAQSDAKQAEPDQDWSEPAPKSRRSGSRRRRTQSAAAEPQTDRSSTAEPPEKQDGEAAETPAAGEPPARKTRRRKSPARTKSQEPAAAAETGEPAASEGAAATTAPASEESTEEANAPKRRRRRRKPAERKAQAAAPESAEAGGAPKEPDTAGAPPEPASSQQRDASSPTPEPAAGGAAATPVEHEVLLPEGATAGHGDSSASRERRDETRGSGRKRGWWRRAIGK